MCYGPEFAGRLLDQWAYLNGVELDFSRPGTPTDNAFIEAFNARIRAECLNASGFFSLADARERIKAWRIDYNTERPHSALGHLTLGKLNKPEESHDNRGRLRGKINVKPDSNFAWRRNGGHVSGAFGSISRRHLNN